MQPTGPQRGMPEPGAFVPYGAQISGGARPFPTLEELQPLLRPRGIAVVGASADPGKFSARIVPALMACGYQGGVYPINPRYGEIAGRPCYARLGDVPGPCDLAIVVVPARAVPEVVREAGACGVRAAIVLSAGFDELGGEGLARAEALRAAAAAGGVRLYGPNCPGLWQVRDGLVYTFSSHFEPEMLRPGPVGLVTQGGALGRAVLDAMETGLGFSFWFSTGNEADLDAADFVALLAEDAQTRVVAAVVEGFRDGRRFLEAAARCRRAGKPVVVLKIGGSAAGARAAVGHTAAPNGDPVVAEAALRAAGCVLVGDVGELVDALQLLARYPVGTAATADLGIGVCTFSGGAGGLLADRAAAAGALLPELGTATTAALRDALPEIAAVGNPTDLTTAIFEDPDLACRALEIMAGDPALGLLLFPLPHRHETFDVVIARRLGELAPRLRLPLAVVAISPVFDREAAAAVLQDAGVPVLPSAGRAALAAARWLEAAGRLPAPAPPTSPEVTCAAVQDPVFGPAVVCGRACRLAPLDESDAKALLKEAGADAGGDAAVMDLARVAVAGGTAQVTLRGASA